MGPTSDDHLHQANHENDQALQNHSQGGDKEHEEADETKPQRRPRGKGKDPKDRSTALGRTPRKPRNYESERQKSDPGYARHVAMVKHHYHSRRAKSTDGEAQQYHLQRAKEELKVANQQHSQNGRMRRDDSKKDLRETEMRRNAQQSLREHKKRVRVTEAAPKSTGRFQSAVSEVSAPQKYLYARMSEIQERNQVQVARASERPAHLKLADIHAKEAAKWKQKAWENGDIPRIIREHGAGRSLIHQELLSPSPVLREQHSGGAHLPKVPLEPVRRKLGRPRTRGVVSRTINSPSKAPAEGSVHRGAPESIHKSRRRPKTQIMETPAIDSQSAEPGPGRQASQPEGTTPGLSQSPSPRHDASRSRTKLSQQGDQDLPWLTPTPHSTPGSEVQQARRAPDAEGRKRQQLGHEAEEGHAEATQRQTQTEHRGTEQRDSHEGHRQSVGHRLEGYQPLVIGRQHSSSSSSSSGMRDLLVNLPENFGRGPILD